MQYGVADIIEKYSIEGLKAYIVAGVVTAASIPLRLTLNGVLDDSSPYALAAIALIIVTTFCGLWPGLFGAIVVVVLGWFFLVHHHLTIVQHSANSILILITACSIAGMTAAMRSAVLAAAKARRESDFMTREMHHRVKNLFAVVASMTTLSARERPDARDVLMGLRERVQALADAHEVAINPNDVVNLRDLAERLLAPHGTSVSSRPRVRINGDSLDLPAEYTTPLGLIFNELATNAAKHGSLTRTKGTVWLSWNRRANVLDIRWEETGADVTQSEPGEDSSGFGSLLVEASVAQLRGSMDRNLTDNGLIVRLSVPLEDPAQNRFRSGTAKATQETCKSPASFLSVLRGSNRFFRRKPRIRDSRS